ncbi:MAG: hypothetical protein QW666_03510 [Candidatus Woesearchaeota archaeon]
MAIQTGSFIFGKDIISFMKGWGDLSWEDIYAEHKPIVQKTLAEAELVAFISKEYSPQIVKKIEDHCVAGLKEIVDGLRAKYSKNTQPKDCDWTSMILDSKRHVPLEQKLLADKALQKTFGKGHPVESYNIAKAVSDEYAAYINNINNETDF